MFKSLYSGVSGLNANLTNLDVIGNNIANSNTVGFKSGRVTFNEMLTQTIKSSSRPQSGGLGGTNPQQIGLGTKVGSIDTNFNQGNFQTTGKKTDLAIQGSGFFVLNDGNSNVYTRAGVFGLDSENVLVNPSTGLRVQGVMAGTDGVIGSGPLTDIEIDPTTVVPAQPSTEVQLMGNLDASADAQGSVLESPTFLVAAEGGDLLTKMSGEDGGDFGLLPGDVVRVNGQQNGAGITNITYTVTSSSTMDSMIADLNTQLGLAGVGANLVMDPSGTGELQVTASGNELVGFSLSATAKTNFNNNFSFNTPIDTTTPGTTSELRAFADENDTLGNVFSADGMPLGIDFPAPPGTSTLIIGGSVGGDSVDNSSVDVTAATTLAEMMSELQYALNINSTPLEMNDEGQMVVRGEVGMAAAIGDISMTEDGHINTELESAFGFTQTQQAVDQKTFSMATTAYDSLGGQHTVSFSFEKVAGENEWVWQANMEGDETILTGQTGRIRFTDAGAISNFTFDDESGSLTFQPQPNGEEAAANVVLDIDYGEIGALTGLTQFEGTGSLQSIANGYGTGTLVDFNIDQSGVITGIFSNDTMQSIARIAVANFSNPDGLMREANNTYRRSGNSGQAVESFAGMGNGVTLVPGALETSNVDLAKEFTNLVVAQRAFQANSRVITTADQVMQELVNLVR